MTEGEVERCEDCNFFLKESLVEWKRKREVVKICKKEDDAIAAAEAISNAKNAKRQKDGQRMRRKLQCTRSSTKYL